MITSSSALRVLLLAAPLACGGRAVESSRAAPEPELAPEPRRPDPTPAVAPRLSCRSAAAPVTQPLARVQEPVQIGERGFAVAWRRVGAEVETVIVSLDARGELAVTPIPVPPSDPLAIGADAGGLVIVSVPLRGTGVLLRVALAADGLPRPGAPTPLPEVVWGWPATIDSDGARAQLRHAWATPDQTVGGETLYTIDLAVGRVVASSPAPPREDPAPQRPGEPPVPQGHSRSLRATHPDGLIQVTWDGGSGMTHSPTDERGQRRYYKHWYFNGGEVSLLRYERGQWVGLDPAPLALAAAEGMMDTGYHPVVLRNGLHAAILLAAQGGGEPAWFQPYLAPCPAKAR